jgi:hypothetical protein
MERETRRYREDVARRVFCSVAAMMAVRGHAMTVEQVQEIDELLVLEWERQLDRAPALRLVR